MANVKVTPFKDYPDKRKFGEPYDSIHPDTPPHTLPPMKNTLFSKNYQHRRWFCHQYFSRRGYNLDTIANHILFALKIDRNGGLVDTQGVLRYPANSHASFSNNYIVFKWETRRARWSKSPFVINAKKSDTITDLFEAAISKANRSIKPYEKRYDKRMKSVTFRNWLFKNSRGKIDFRTYSRTVKKHFSIVKLADAGARMTLSRTIFTAMAYPFLTQDRLTYNSHFQRKRHSNDYDGACFALAYATPKHTFRIPAHTNFISWNMKRHNTGWVKYLSSFVYAPNLPSGQSQQVVRSFPIYMGKRDNPARVLAESYGQTNLYGRLCVFIVRKHMFTYRDLSYPASTFSYMDNQEVEFTDEDREWNIPEVFEHRTWDPYEINNWTGSDLIRSIRKKNLAHVKSKVKHLLDTDPTFLARSGDQRPNYEYSNLTQPEGE